MDTYNYVKINNPRSRKYILEMIELYNLKDTYRALQPQARRYTWRRKHPIKQARLDYFIVSESFMDIIDSCKINPGYRSDHSFLELNLIINPFHRGPGIWKFNCELLKHSEYIDKINKTIMDFRFKYAVPVYNIEYINELNDQYLQFTIDDDILLEMLLLEIRYVTIKYSSALKQATNAKENLLIKSIEELETSNKIQSWESIQEMKNELQAIREIKLKGHMIRYNQGHSGYNRGRNRHSISVIWSVKILLTKQ